MSLASDERRRVLPDGSLLFAHVVHSKHNKPDEGTYQCVATMDNMGSISSRTARLSVAGERRPSFPTFFLLPYFADVLDARPRRFLRGPPRLPNAPVRFTPCSGR